MLSIPNSLLTLVSRESLPIWLKNAGFTGQAVEIGTFRGEFAAHWLTHWPGHLTTIDPFEQQPQSVYLDGCVAGLDMEQVEAEAIGQLQPWLQGGRCRLVKGLSLDVASEVEVGSLDCCYIDGNHAYEAVIADIQAWWPKLRPGGLLGLHDTYSRNDAYQRCGVWDAVFQFANEINQKPLLTCCTSSWFEKQ